MKRADLELLLFHGVFCGAGVALVLADIEAPLGWRLFAAGVFYNLVLPFFAVSRVEPRWVRIWSFLLPLSALQILPDWYLASKLGTLYFTDLGFPLIGPVSGFMALLWIIPLFLVVYAGDRFADWSSKARSDSRLTPEAAGTLAAGAVSLVLFVAAEATLTLIPVWHPVGVKTFGSVALYVLLPEAALGAAAFRAFRLTDHRGLLSKLLAAGLVMVFYLVSLDLCYRLLG